LGDADQTAGQLVGYRADLWNLRTTHTSLREELTKQLPLKEEKLVKLPNHLARLRQSFCLNTNTRTGCRRSSIKTPKTVILFFLNWKCFC
jgi:hypothetical protein